MLEPLLAEFTASHDVHVTQAAKDILTPASPFALAMRKIARTRGYASDACQSRPSPEPLASGAIGKLGIDISVIGAVVSPPGLD